MFLCNWDQQTKWKIYFTCTEHIVIYILFYLAAACSSFKTHFNYTVNIFQMQGLFASYTGSFFVVTELIIENESTPDTLVWELYATNTCSSVFSTSISISSSIYAISSLSLTISSSDKNVPCCLLFVEVEGSYRFELKVIYLWWILQEQSEKQNLKPVIHGFLKLKVYQFDLTV